MREDTQETDVATPAPLALTEAIDIYGPMKLGQILDVLKADDDGEGRLLLADGRTELTDAERAMLAEKLREKIDSIRMKCDRWNDEAKRLKAYAKELNGRAKALENKAKGLYGRVIFHMRNHKLETLPGNRFKAARLKENECCVVDEFAITSDVYLRLRGFIKRKYEWKVDAIKAALKAGDAPQELLKIARIEHNYTVNIK